MEIFDFAKSLKLKSLTISILPSPSEIKGKPEKTPSFMPYDPSLITAALNISPSLVLCSTAFTVSHAALAAEEAEEAPLA